MKFLIVIFSICIMFMPLTTSANLLVFEDIDDNADGWIDKVEASQRQDLIQNWNIIDSNRDGVIGDSEYLRYEGRELYVPPYDSQYMDPGAGPI